MPTTDITTLEVKLGDRSYPIMIGESLLSNAASIISDHLATPHCFIITDTNIAPLYLDALIHDLKDASIEATPFIVEAGETSKSFNVLASLMEDMLCHRPERKTTLIALGGGVIGDLTGFCASILLRGVPFIQIPTSLLSQVDSSVGGKTGINSQYGKNLIGSFYQPKLVLADIAVLASLSEREYLAGYAEIVKYALIRDAAFFDWLIEHEADIKHRNPEALQYCVAKSCQHKADIVAQDERESGVRALLNLGHTFGHALEAFTGYSDKLVHGEAVALGMVLAFGYSVKAGLCKQDALDRIIQHFNHIGLPTQLQDVQAEWDIDALMASMAQDKKVADGNIIFILANDIGESFIAKDINSDEVAHYLASLLD